MSCHSGSKWRPYQQTYSSTIARVAGCVVTSSTRPSPRIQTRRPSRRLSRYWAPVRIADMSASHETAGDRPQRAIVDMKDVAGARFNGAGEGTAQHELTGLERNVEGRELVGKPGDAVGRMVEHRGSHTRLFDDIVAMTQHADPAQVDVHGLDRPAADDQRGVAGIVGDAV